jgi:succinate dehydrogenase flavin-adding protein (antitoxin of CptAB toxin-antitoxin module)
MKKGETRELDYISRVFSGLSVEKKDKVLQSARGLLKIQDKDIYPLLADVSVPPNEAEKLV